tara:strand:- start:4 stop:123 length:120 start_codon:yes stop_codon:yes gene_type:complete
VDLVKIKKGRELWPPPRDISIFLFLMVAGARFELATFGL